MHKSKLVVKSLDRFINYISFVNGKLIEFRLRQDTVQQLSHNNNNNHVKYFRKL